VQVEARFLEHRPVGEGCDQRMLGQAGDAAFGDTGQEASRQQHAVARVANARQRLGTGEAFALEIDLGLVPHLEPAVAERLVNLDPGRCLGCHGMDQGAPLFFSEFFDRTGPAPGLGGL
jgi:hypothetical protein